MNAEALTLPPHAILQMLITRHLHLAKDRIASMLPLNRLGLDSLDLLNLAAAIDLELGVYLPPETLASGVTMAKLGELVALESSQPSSALANVPKRLQLDGADVLCIITQKPPELVAA